MLKRTDASTNTVPIAGSSVWTFAVAIILLSHYAIDVYAGFVPSLLGVIESDFQLSQETAAILLGWGTFFSGMSQPLFAWVSDRWNTRLCAAAGLVMGATGICLIGAFGSVPVLFVVYGIAAMGIGMYHPIAASTIGRLAGVNRGRAISWFFVAGMAGGFCGSSLAPMLATGSGSLLSLSWMIVPGILMAIVLHMTIRSIPHKRVRPVNAEAGSQSHDLSSYPWGSISVLYLTCVVRYIINIALIFLIVRWVQQPVALLHPDWSQEEVAKHAAPLVGRLNGAMILGMGIGGITAGTLVRAGHERGPLIWLPALFAPAIMLIGYIGNPWLAYVAFVAAGIGYGAMMPVNISLAQRLMPGHSSLASGLMLGGAWAFAFFGPILAYAILQRTNLSFTFLTVGATLMASGLLCLLLDDETIRGSVATDLVGE